MTDSNIFKLNKPEKSDPLQEVLREGARKMLAAAIETEVSVFIEQYGALKTDEDKAAVVRNGIYLINNPMYYPALSYICQIKPVFLAIKIKSFKSD